jgi:hypothetical protein
VVERATWLPLDGGGTQQVGTFSIETDEAIVAVGGTETHGPVHATWHPIRLEAGPYLIEGELATMPGFDPGRALTRPTGEFVVLREVRVRLLDRPDAGEASHAEALINRYCVDKVDADLMLGFFFPGAHVDPPPSVGPPGSPGNAEAPASPAATDGSGSSGTPPATEPLVSPN